MNVCIGTCLPIIDIKNNCTVINGALNIYLTALAPPDEVVRYNVLTTIKDSMSRGIYTDIIQGLFLVQYVGPTILTPQDTLGTSSATTTNTANQESITSTQIIILTAIITFTVIAVGIFILSIVFPKKKISAVCTRSDIEFTSSNVKDGTIPNEEGDVGSETIKTVIKNKDFTQYNHAETPNTVQSFGAWDGTMNEDASVVVDHIPSSAVSVASEHSAKTRKTGWNSRSEVCLSLIMTSCV